MRRRCRPTAHIERHRSLGRMAHEEDTSLQIGTRAAGRGSQESAEIQMGLQGNRISPPTRRRAELSIGRSLARLPIVPQAMSFYGQLDSINDEFCIADCGMICVFICFGCNTTLSMIHSY